MNFTIWGDPYDLSKDSSEKAILAMKPDPIRQYYIILRRRRYPVNQVLECITGLPRVQCNTGYSVSILHRLGFKIHHYAK